MTISINSAALSHGVQVDVTNTLSQANVRKSFGDLTTETLKVSGSYVFDGVVIADGKTLTDATNLDLDLYDLGAFDLGNGAGRDSAGQAHTNATIHYMRIKCDSGSTGSLVVDSSQANGWTAWLPSGTTTLAPGSMIQGYWPAGLAVTDASNHILRLTASGGDATYSIEFLSKSV
jgi:hypothetical protein